MKLFEKIKYQLYKTVLNVKITDLSALELYEDIRELYTLNLKSLNVINDLSRDTHVSSKLEKNENMKTVLELFECFEKQDLEDILKERKLKEKFFEKIFGLPIPYKSLEHTPNYLKDKNSTSSKPMKNIYNSSRVKKIVFQNSTETRYIIKHSDYKILSIKETLIIDQERLKKLIESLKN